VSRQTQVCPTDITRAALFQARPGMTVLGIAVALSAVPRPVAKIVAIQHIIEVLSLMIALGWVFLIMTGTVSVALISTPALGKSS